MKVVGALKYLGKTVVDIKSEKLIIWGYLEPWIRTIDIRSMCFMCMKSYFWLDVNIIDRGTESGIKYVICG